MDNLTWQEIALALAGLFEVIVRLTPTKTDNTILARVLWVLNKIIPNRKKNGNTY